MRDGFQPSATVFRSYSCHPCNPWWLYCFCSSRRLKSKLNIGRNVSILPCSNSVILGGLTNPNVARSFFTFGCSRQTENASILTSTSRSGFDGPASLPRHQVAPSSALRAYSLQAEGKIVAPCAINQNIPARQTAVSKKKCNPNHAA